MKYFCKICNSDYFAEGTTHETLKNDIEEHEKGENHRRNMKDNRFFQYKTVQF